ncbi:hypothetical protein ACEPAI_3989 [Sanghuangporus weigelae]
MMMYLNLMASSISQDRQRTSLGSPHLHGHPSASVHAYGQNTSNNMSSGFSVAPGQGLNDALAQSRPQYQPGYLLSLAQSQVLPVAGQRHEEPLLIPTRAKTSSTYLRNVPSDFGSDSMFETTSSKHRHRETSDGDGPPTSSVVDLVTEIHQQRQSTRHPVSTSKTNNRPNSPPTVQYQTLFVVVFGYPPTKYSTTVAHFQGIAEGGSTEPDRHGDVENAFKIGYKLPWEAARACKWNGEILSGEGGRWMIGVKWLDPVAAEQILGAGARISSLSSPGLGAETPVSSTQERTDMIYDQNSQVEAPQQTTTRSVGTPIKLVPSSSAFRKAAPGLNRKESPFQVPTGADGSPVKARGMFGQVSDLIFGW